MSFDAPTMERGETAGLPTLVLVGEFDLAVADDLRQHLHAMIDDGVAALGVDLAGVSFLDSSCLGVLLESQRRAAEASIGVVLVSPSATCTRLLEITGVEDLFEIRTS